MSSFIFVQSGRCSERVRVRLAGLVAVLMVLCFWLLLPLPDRVDEGADFRVAYEPVALNLLDGKGFVTSGGELLTYYPPGYPLTIAAAYLLGDLLHVRRQVMLNAVALLCWYISATALAGLARRFLSWRGSLVAVLAWSSCPFILWLSKQPNSEVVFMPVFYASLVCCWSVLEQAHPTNVRFLGAGALAGVAMLIRPLAIGLGAIYALALLVVHPDLSRRRRLVGAGLIVAGNMIMISPWLGFIYAKTGKFVCLSSNGAAAIRDGLTFSTMTGKPYRQPAVVPDDVESLVQETQVKAVRGELESVGDLIRYLGGQWVRQPRLMFKLYGIKAARAWYGTDSLRHEAFIRALQCVYLTLVILGGCAAWRHGLMPRPFMILLFGLTAYFWAVTTLVLSILRYMTPMLGAMFLLVPAGIVSRGTLLRKR